jgi:hypothetical protein
MLFLPDPDQRNPAMGIIRQEPPFYRISGCTICSDDPDFEQRLTAAFMNGVRPQCLCRQPAPDMYITRWQERHILRRMPGSSQSHAPDCKHALPAPAMVRQSSVIRSQRASIPTRDVWTRQHGPYTTIHPAFRLHCCGKHVPDGDRADTEMSAERFNSRNRFRLADLIDFLWTRAGLAYWKPAFSGKRNWAVVRSRLLAAANNIRMLNRPLTVRLYIPQPFRRDHQTGIAASRAIFLEAYRTHHAGPYDLVVMLAEVKLIQPAVYGFRFVLRHAPDFPVFFNALLSAGLRTRFRPQLRLFESSDDVRLMMLATASINRSGAAIIDDLALMPVNRAWVPAHTPALLALTEALIQQNRNFEVTPRSGSTGSCIRLFDTALPTRLTICDPPDEKQHTKIKSSDSVAMQRPLTGWVWADTDRPWPELPPAAHRQPPQRRAREGKSASELKRP